MATRTVRLDEEAEQALAEVRRVTGLSVAAALKRGLLLARGAEREALAERPFGVYATLDLGGSRAWPKAVLDSTGDPRAEPFETHRAELAEVAEDPFGKPAVGSRRRAGSTKRSKTAKRR